MPPEIASNTAPLGRVLARLPAEWRAPLARLGLAWAAILLVFLPDWAAMAGQWWDSSTYNHILLIPFIIGWLSSQRMAATLAQRPQGWWPGLALFAGAAFLWMLGSFAGLSIAKQLAVVVMAQAAFLALMGPRVAATQLFPLFYMLFMVPAGDELIPTLQTITAKLTMAMLHITQIPATIDGVFITTPFGYFEVAEACSGVKFLIAMLAYGALVCNVCFRSPWRRAGFMVVSAVVPILANGLRAWGTIWIAGWYGIEFAASFDHVFYGWVFFAIVMALVMLVGWKFFDRAVDAQMADAAAVEASPILTRLSALRLGQNAALGGLAALVALFVGWSAAADSLSAPLPSRISVPQVAGWTISDSGPTTDWTPLHAGADHRLKARYRDVQGRTVDLSYALYAAQGEGREAGGFGQGALPMDSHWAWEAPGPDGFGGKADVIQAPGPVHRVTVTWYRTGDLLTGSNAKLKLVNILDRLLLRRRPTAVLILSAEEGQSAPAEQLIRDFLSATGPQAEWMDRIARGG
ncbi:exosortase A [Novosphingobium cyanobacteriorum]|uniref:Exosortase A n=1 Tax=Novosphingobium cyanobacteriorum TaxID=3024215 RepID=A0ABT6CFB8_9SPHN|nr:exosortase A [Novosphingobium cyanobacteriorum]MDF8332239.1 exosortase A [Novosphingobium cyanobacteriorum]